MPMRYFILIFVLVFSTFAKAQDVQTIPPGNDNIVYLAKGLPAPFEGQLFDNSTALRWGFWLQQYKLRLKSDVELEKQSCKINLEFKDKELKIEADKSTAIEKDLQDRLLRSEKARIVAEDEVRDPPFWRTFQFGVLIGVSGTVLVTVAAVVGLLSIK